ncbi:MAG: hypothetical protein ABIZ80_24305 [Bryobacteraceae bacterium]
MTLDGTTTGTPAYMAPELAMGSGQLDGRCDLYGLGCVAYWLLTGSLVFPENNATAMMLAHLNKTPVPPSERSELSVPACLDEAILMCLAKEPAKRPAMAEDLARMLGNCGLAGDWSPDDAEQWWQINIPEGSAQAEPEAQGGPVILSGSADTM